MKAVDKFLNNNNSEVLLQEQSDIDFNLKRPGLIKYYFLASIRWIISYWYITFPVILVVGYIGMTAGLQYIDGNNKPVWGTRTKDLKDATQLTKAAEKLSSNSNSSFSHYKIYVSGPEIHIEIGLQSKNVENYGQAKKYINEAYKELISQLPSSDQKLVKSSYSVMAIVAGVEPDKTDTNLHAIKSKQAKTFTFYHK